MGHLGQHPDDDEDNIEGYDSDDDDAVHVLLTGVACRALLSAPCPACFPRLSRWDPPESSLIEHALLVCRKG
jgi:hypothetical protein